MILNSLLALLLLSLYGCQEKEFKASQVLGGVSVSIEVLNHGAQIYQAKFLSCHGAKGDGAGITYRALRIKPRNLTQGLYKFGLSVDGGLPADQDFHQILERGLVGTPMIPWKLKVEERHAVIQYIKTFAPQVWGEKYQSPTRHEFSDDPFGEGKSAQAIALGEVVYHEKAQCFACHPAYRDLPAMKSLTGDETLSLDSDTFQSKSQPTDYYTAQFKEQVFEIIPPDFTRHNIRSAHSIAEIMVRLGVGVAGTTMPAWKDSLSDEELWAVSYYVDSLRQKKPQQFVAWP